MKKNILILTLVLICSFGVTAQKKGEAVVHFRSNMHCAACENTLFEHLRFEKGVRDLKLDHLSNTIRIVYTGSKTSSETLAAAIEKKGYKANPITMETYQNLQDSVRILPPNP